MRADYYYGVRVSRPNWRRLVGDDGVAKDVVTTSKSLGLLAKDGSVECMFYELNEETVEGITGCLIRYRP